MNRKTKVKLADGRELDAVELGFQTGGEHWNEYMLDDGSVVKIKLVVTNVVRLEGEYDPNGLPVYLAQSTNVMAVSAPDNLRKKE
jgi:hypothetical protein